MQWILQPRYVSERGTLSRICVGDRFLSSAGVWGKAPMAFPDSSCVVVSAKKRRFYLCWVRAASGPFLENNFHPLKVGQKWVFVQCPGMGPKWVLKVGFGPCSHPKTLFCPLLSHFWSLLWPLTKTHHKPTLSVNKLFSKKGPESSPDPT